MTTAFCSRICHKSLCKEWKCAHAKHMNLQPCSMHIIVHDKRCHNSLQGVMSRYHQFESTLCAYYTTLQASPAVMLRS